MFDRTFKKAIARILPEGNFFLDPVDCYAYAFDNSRRIVLPKAVAFPENTEMVRDIVKLCHTHQVPLVARGRGTGTTGASVPVSDGIVLSLERLRFLGAVNASERTIRVGAGILNGEVQKAAEKEGFFWAPDPTSAPYSTVGGNIATNAGGPRTIKFGATRDNVLALTAVTGDGQIIHPGFAVRKVSTGYDLTRLLVGSEGTLAIVTEALLKLLPLPQSSMGIVATYGSIQAAAEAIVAVMRGSFLPAALELMDNKCLALLKKHHPGIVPEAAVALLLLEVDDCNALERIAEKLTHADSLEVKKTPDTKELWRARKALSPLLRDLAPKKINEDIVVPIAFLPRFLEKLDQLEQQYRIPILAFGHAGDGNLHVNMLVDPKLHEEKTVNACLEAIFRTVLDLSGALSGEHGIGLAKRPFMTIAFDASTLEIMARIKKAFDPTGILNPGKLLPFVAK